MDHPTFQKALSNTADEVNRALDDLLTQTGEPLEYDRPQRLVDAMRHGVLNGGKRVRPFLLMQSAALFGVDSKQARTAACALEMLHSYSLIHDDLPAMDDDDLRRGLPTVHKAFDEATAILAGDALLTYAFDLLSGESCHESAEIRVRLVSLLARAAGQGGMIGGQMLDIAAQTLTPDEQGIRQLQAMKTGALLAFACQAGAVLGRADPISEEKLQRFGQIIGLAFQLADDLLDVTSDAQTMGKAVGKDADQHKGTLVGIYGVEKTKAVLADLVKQANECLASFGNQAEMLRQTARFIAERKN